MFKKGVIFALVMMLCMSSLTACGGNNESTDNDATATTAEAKATVAKEALIVALDSDIASLDPQGHNDTKSEQVSILVYNRLFRLDQNLEIIPDLAETWEKETDKSWLITVKKGVMFHDGTEMKASDVKFSLERSQGMAKVQHVLSEVEKIEVVDDYTVRLTTKSVFAPFLYTLTHAGTSILSEAYVNSGDEFVNPVGTGPYKYLDWSSGESVTLEKNEDYFDANNMGKMPKIKFRVIPEGTSRTIALETGEVDIVQELEALDIPKIEEHENLTLYTTPSTRIDYFGMNTQKAPFDNKLVRQAMNYAIDKEAVMIIAINGQGTLGESVLAPSLMGYVAGEYDYNPEKAKELLAQAGYPDGFELKIWASGDQRKRMAEVIQANLLDVGVKAEIEMYEWATYIDLLMKGEESAFVLGWSSNVDPDQTLTPLFHSQSIGGMNFTRTNMEKVDEFIETGRVELDLAKRKALYNDFHRYIMDEAPMVPLFVKDVVVGANKDLKGVELYPNGLFNLEKAHY